ncbi:hypothetical protein ACJX0J_028231, partial [Zea mays]
YRHLHHPLDLGLYSQIGQYKSLHMHHFNYFHSLFIQHYLPYMEILLWQFVNANSLILLNVRLHFMQTLYCPNNYTVAYYIPGNISILFNHMFITTSTAQIAA